MQKYQIFVDVLTEIVIFFLLRKSSVCNDRQRFRFYESFITIEVVIQ